MTFAPRTIEKTDRHPMGLYRAMLVLDLELAAHDRAALRWVRRGAVMRGVRIAAMRRRLQGLREVRLAIGNDGWKLP